MSEISDYDKQDKPAAPQVPPEARYRQTALPSAPPPPPQQHYRAPEHYTPPVIPPAPFPQPAPPPQKKEPWWRVCLHGCMVASFVTMLCLIALVTVSLGGCYMLMSNLGRALNEDPEQMAQSGAGAVTLGQGVKAAHITINGMITDSGGGSSWFIDENSSEAALAKIRIATADPSIKGILLSINSGGGGITSSDVIWDALEKFKDADPDNNRNVVVMMGTTAASGAYYISVAGDYIVANPTTLTGSIGVIMTSLNIKELARKVGFKDVTIKSGANKTMLSPFEDITPEQEKMLQTLVDSLHTRFVKIVAEGRSLEEAKVRAIADGSVMLATEALELGLIDEVGYIEDAKAKMEELLGAKVIYLEGNQEPPFLKLFRSPSFWGACMSKAVAIAGEGLAGQSAVQIK